MEKKSKKSCRQKLIFVDEVEKVTKKKDVSIDILNNDCLKYIFLFLSVIDRFRIRRVCERWRDVVEDSWYNIKRLDISSPTWNLSKRTETADLDKILQKCGTFVKKISINRSHRFNIGTLHTIGLFCPNLQSVNVSGLTFSKSEIRTLADKCTNITKLTLGPSTSQCDNELAYLFKQNQNLEYLAINYNNILGTCLLSLPQRAMRTIILNDCFCIQDSNLSMALKKLKNLEAVMIGNCKNLTKYTLEAIDRYCKNLKTLVLTRISFDPEDMTFLIELTSFRFINLQFLEIRYNPTVSNDFLTDLVQHCQQLTSVDITGCFNVNDAGLTAIGTLTKLYRLVINYMKGRVTDDGMRTISNLKIFECRECKFSDQGMIMLIKSSPELRFLDLSNCNHITNTTVEAAIDFCNNRRNNVILTIIIGGTAVPPMNVIIGRQKILPLLYIRNHNASKICSHSLFLRMWALDDIFEAYDDYDRDYNSD